MNKFVGAISPTAFAHFMYLFHILVILAIIQIFKNYFSVCDGNLCSVITPVTAMTH